MGRSSRDPEQQEEQGRAETQRPARPPGRRPQEVARAGRPREAEQGQQMDGYTGTSWVLPCLHAD